MRRRRRSADSPVRPGGGAEIAQQPGEPSGGKFRDGGLLLMAAENLVGDDRLRMVTALQIEPPSCVEQKRSLHVPGGAAECGGVFRALERIDPRIESGQTEGRAGGGLEEFFRPLFEQTAAVSGTDRPAGECGGEEELRGGIRAAEPEHSGGEFQIDRLEFAGGGQLGRECGDVLIHTLPDDGLQFPDQPELRFVEVDAAAGDFR